MSLTTYQLVHPAVDILQHLLILVNTIVCSPMSSVSKAQQHLMGADLARAREGKPTRTGMNQKQLKEFAGTPTTGLPEHKHPLRDFRRGNGVN
jgi:hypothetical protein